MTLQKAKALLESGNLEEAREHLLQAARNDMHNPSIWLLLSGIASRTNDWELGLKSFKRLSAIRPSSRLASSGLVQCMYNLGLYEDAIVEIDRFRGVADKADENDQSVMNEHQAIRDRILKQDDGY